jgi:hypothetical protein
MSITPGQYVHHDNRIGELKEELELIIYEIWMSKDYSEWSIFSPEEATLKEVSNKAYIYTTTNELMFIVASLYGTISDVKDVMLELHEDYDNNVFAELIK